MILTRFIGLTLMRLYCYWYFNC